jgi:hypothetical protein
MTRPLDEVLLRNACKRTLRNWLIDLGRDHASLREHTIAGIYFLADARRLVHARAALAPRYPASLDQAEADILCDLARRLEVQAWEARIVLRANYHAQAILWRRLDSAPKERAPATAA